MKNTFLAIAIAAIITVGCTGNHPKESEQKKDVHTHEDGSVHQNHEEDTVISQEEFTAPVDSTLQKDNGIKEHIHGEDDSHKHPHNH